MGKFGKDLIAGGSRRLCRCRAGTMTGVVELLDVRTIRPQLHMSQHEFADAYRIPLATLKNWEQGSRAPAAAYLQAIARKSQIIREALRHG
jgi:putative transcriptional regulator